MTLPIAARAPRLQGAERPSVLLVDDEPLILDVLSRTLRRSYDIATATSGAAGLVAIETGGPFAVIVSDMRMPGMDGVQFLSRSRAMSPNAVRVLMSGHGDVDSAAADDDGQIFRRLQKPCPPDQLEETLAAAVQLHRFIIVERELLERTLRESVEVLTNLLALVSPVAFARSLRVTRTVTALAGALGVHDRWAIELAAMLSELGALTVPTDVLDRYYRGDALGADEGAMIDSARDLSHQLISHIPRIDAVRDILSADHLRFDGAGSPAAVPRDEVIPIGARLLSIASAFDRLESRGERAADCLDEMEGRTGLYDPRVLQALRTLKCGVASAIETREMRLADVEAGMVFARDVVGSDGLILIGRGQEATPSLLLRIRNLWADLPLRHMPRLLIPTAATVHGPNTNSPTSPAQ